MDRQYSLDLFAAESNGTEVVDPAVNELIATGDATMHDARDPPPGDAAAEAGPEADRAMPREPAGQESGPEPDVAIPAEPFGRWLLAQVRRGDWIDDLAKAARADAGFPKQGSPDDVRARLASFGIEGDVYEQVDDAERCWLSAMRDCAG